MIITLPENYEALPDQEKLLRLERLRKEINKEIVKLKVRVETEALRKSGQIDIEDAIKATEQ